MEYEFLSENSNFKYKLCKTASVSCSAFYKITEPKCYVPIKIKSNSVGSVVNIESMDTSLYGSDPKYRAVAYRARHAVNDSSPLPLLANKYESLKTFVFNFETSFITRAYNKFRNI